MLNDLFEILRAAKSIQVRRRYVSHDTSVIHYTNIKSSLARFLDEVQNVNTVALARQSGTNTKQRSLLVFRFDSSQKTLAFAIKERLAPVLKLKKYSLIINSLNDVTRIKSIFDLRFHCLFEANYKSLAVPISQERGRHDRRDEDMALNCFDC